MSERVTTYWEPLGEDRFGSPCLMVSVCDKDTLDGVDELVVGRDVVEGGYLYLGQTSEENPTRLYGARRIEGFVKIPNLRTLAQQRVAVLI